jgi:hypothetical protein
MNNTLHTPSPWKCDLVSLKIWANDGNTEIARTSSDVSISEEEANARLISAAPDLLSTLQDICAMIVSPNDTRADILAHARTAIAKAEGK